MVHRNLPLNASLEVQLVRADDPRDLLHGGFNFSVGRVIIRIRMLLNQLFQLLNLEPSLGQRMFEERQDGGLIIRAQRQPRVSEPRDVSNQRIN